MMHSASKARAATCGKYFSHRIAPGRPGNGSPFLLPERQADQRETDIVSATVEQRDDKDVLR